MGEDTSRIGKLEGKVRSLTAQVAALRRALGTLRASVEGAGIKADVMARTYRAERRKGIGRSPAKWGLSNDYATDWNERAERYGWRTVRGITKRRAMLLLAREQEVEWDWGEILLALDGTSADYLSKQRWWKFDFLVGSDQKGEVNYVKLLEGLYSDKDSPRRLTLPEVS